MAIIHENELRNADVMHALIAYGQTTLNKHVAMMHSLLYWNLLQFIAILNVLISVTIIQ